MLSISQLCDQKLNVKFTKDNCKVLNRSEEVVLKGSQTSDNCYKLIHSHTCHTTSLDNTDLWHQKLGHLNFKNLTKIANAGAVREIPPLSRKELRVCGPCQIGKHVKLSHNLLQQINTSRVIELLHMDLMGRMQVESIAGKRYVFMRVDDFLDIFGLTF